MNHGADAWMPLSIATPEPVAIIQKLRQAEKERDAWRAMYTNLEDSTRGERTQWTERGPGFSQSYSIDQMREIIGAAIDYVAFSERYRGIHPAVQSFHDRLKKSLEDVGKFGRSTFSA